MGQEWYLLKKLEMGSHTLVVKTTNTKNPSATSTRIYIDELYYACGERERLVPNRKKWCNFNR